MSYAKCCEQGSERVSFAEKSGVWCCSTGYYEVEAYPIKFCPFCGHDLSQPVYTSLEEALLSLVGLKPLELVFDVDGVLADNSDPNVAYADRKPYPWVAATLTALKEAGHTIRIQTARYMKKFDGDQVKANEYGGQELRWWLRENNIPFDHACLGKCSANIYFDDRGCRVDSNAGTTDWSKNLVPAIRQAQKWKG